MFSFLNTLSLSGNLGKLPGDYQAYIHVGFFDLVGHPNKWNRKKVTVEGVILFGSEDPNVSAEGSAILIRDDDPEHNRITVWLYQDWYSELREFSGKSVLIYGIFTGICNSPENCLLLITPEYIEIQAEPVGGADRAR